MKPIRVAINGFGRIGRAFVRRSWGRGVEIVAVNDLGRLENLAYLLKYDTVYKRAPFSVEAKDGSLWLDGKEVKFLSEKDPANLPWKDLDIDVVIESTGFFTDYNKAKAHVDAGAKHVVISAPVDAFSVRKQPKDHGTGRRIEGNFAAGRRVVVIEDVITSGGSALQACEVVEAEGGIVLGVLAIIDRESGGREAIEARGYKVITLFRVSELLTHSDSQTSAAS